MSTRTFIILVYLIMAIVYVFGILGAFGHPYLVRVF